MKSTPINSICILRLSAIGDVLMALPAIMAIRQQLPKLNITWVVGKTEAALLKNIEGINLVVFDKKHSWKQWFLLRKTLKKQRFDVLLHMQPTLRANIISLAINAVKKVGFDAKNSKDGQMLFINKTLAYQQNNHFVDGFFRFAQYLGCNNKCIDLPALTNEQDEAFAQHHLNYLSGAKTVAINTCASSSFGYRNWTVEKFTELVEQIKQLNVEVVLIGDNAEEALQTAQSIEHRTGIANLVGKTTLTQLSALIARAHCLVSVDSAPVHIADIVGTPVIGLYGATNPAQTGSYCYQHHTISRYPSNVAWGSRLKSHKLMEGIDVEEVRAMVEVVLRANKKESEADNSQFFITKNTGISGD